MSREPDARSSPAESTIPSDLREQSVRALMASGKFRKARDELKSLCKLDRARYLPLLIEANVGLAQEMLAKGLTSEAGQVVAYLKTIASREVIQNLELQVAASSGEPADLIPRAVDLVTANDSAVPPADLLRWVDHLVVSFAPIPASTPAQLRLADEVRRVHEALDAIAAGRNETALEVIRPLPRESRLGHWRWFVRGLAAFHSGDPDKAGRCFEEVPGDSVPGRARRPYQLLLEGTPAIPAECPEAAIEIAGRLGGEAGWGPLIARAQKLWQAGHLVKAYQLFRDSIPEFPCEGTNPRAVLSDFFFTSIFRLPREQLFACEDYFLELEVDELTKNPAEMRMIRRVFCLILVDRAGPEFIKDAWCKFVADHARVHGENRKLASLAHGWLGEMLASRSSAGHFGYFGDRLPIRDEPGAVAALKQAIDLDSTNLAAHLRLCALYADGKKTSERNRLLDVMSARFPDRKEVLVLAAAGCLDRKAFVKGLTYLDQALQQDRLDPAVPDLMVSGLTRQAAQAFASGRPDQGREALGRIEPFLIEQPENFWRNPWCHRIRAGLLEARHGDPEIARELVGRALESGPSPVAVRYFGHLARPFLTGRHNGASPFHAELEVALRHPTIAVAAMLVHIWQFWRATAERLLPVATESWLNQYLVAVAQQDLTPEEALNLVQLLQTEPALHAPARLIIRRILINDPLNPAFRLHQHLLERIAPDGPAELAALLQDIIAEAARRGDERTARKARECLADLDRRPGPGGRPAPDDVVDDFAGDSGEDPWESVPDQPFPPNLPSFAPAMLTDLLEGLANLPASEIMKIRKSMPGDIPPEFLDELLAAAGHPVVPPPRPHGPKPSDPDQLNLL